MVRISIEVRNGAARFSVAVRAKSIRRALSIAEKRYPSSVVKVQFPIDPEGFFFRDRAAVEGQIELEERERVAA